MLTLPLFGHVTVDPKWATIVRGKIQLFWDFSPNNNMFGDWSAIIGTVGSISGSAPSSWWSCDHVSQKTTMIHVKKFQWIGDFSPKNNMFGDWSAIIDTVGSIFGSDPPSWWPCDHVSQRATMVHVMEGWSTTVRWHLCGLCGCFSPRSDDIYVVLWELSATVRWHLCGLDGSGPPRSDDIYVVLWEKSIHIHAILYDNNMSPPWDLLGPPW